MQFFSDIWNNIYRTLIAENRYKFYLTGLKNTLLISVGGILLGVFIGMILAFFVYSNKKFGNFKIVTKFVNAYVGLFRSTPMLLQVMILSVALIFIQEKIIVAIIAFGLNSGAYVSEIMRGGLEAVDEGQMEAGRSLGLNVFQTIFSIILPQAIKKALPALGNEFIALIKETSIVSAVAILDITKAASIITSRTYEAFTPLIISGLMYLCIVLLLTKAQKYMERRLAQSDR